jgi:hypothetical protein
LISIATFILWRWIHRIHRVGAAHGQGNANHLCHIMEYETITFTVRYSSFPDAEFIYVIVLQANRPNAVYSTNQRHTCRMADTVYPPFRTPLNHIMFIRPPRTVTIIFPWLNINMENLLQCSKLLPPPVIIILFLCIP